MAGLFDSLNGSGSIVGSTISSSNIAATSATISNQFLAQLQQSTMAQQAQSLNWVPAIAGQWGVTMGGGPVGHFGSVRDFRRKFKEYSKADFRKMGKSPVVKEILVGLTKLNKDEIAERIKEHIA